MATKSKKSAVAAVAQNVSKTVKAAINKCLALEVGHRSCECADCRPKSKSEQ